MNNLRAICDAAIADCYGNTIEFANTFSPNQVRKLLDVIELQREALEDCVATIDDDSVKTTTDDDEEESWVNHSSITYIAETALAKSDELLK